MFVLYECYKEVQNSDSPYMAVALAVVLAVCIAVGVWAIVKGRDE